jgi:hypothetical protein
MATFAVLASQAQPALAQSRQAQPSNGNWALADRFATDKLRPFVYSSSVAPNWINETDSLWYSWEDNTGTRFNLVVPKTRTKRPLFDHMRMAELLSEALKKPVEPNKLPITRLSFRKDGHTIRFSADSATRFDYDLNAGTLRKLAADERDPDEPPATQGRRGGGGGGFGRGGGRGDFRNYSPDSTAFAFARDHNLYIVEVGKPAKTNPDTVRISTDGVKDYSFGARDTTDTQQQDDEIEDENGGQGGRGGRGRDPRVRANVTWSPDS